MCVVRPSRAFFDSSTQSKMTKERAAGIRRMRHATSLRTMRRLWCDASVAASEVGVEFGTWTSRREIAQRRERRKEGSGRCSYARGGGRSRTRSMSKFQARSSARPGHWRSAPSDGRRAALRVVDDARVAGGIAADGRVALHVVDDARVAGGIAANGMNITARPRRRVAGQDTYCQRRILRHPMLSLYGTGVFSLSRKIFCQKL